MSQTQQDIKTSLPDSSNTILKLTLPDLKDLVAKKIITSLQASQIWTLFASDDEQFNTPNILDNLHLDQPSSSSSFIIQSRTDYQHILLNDYYIFNIIPFYYILVIIAFFLLFNAHRLLNLLLSQKDIAKPMKILAQFFKFILLIIQIKFVIWLESGQAYLLSLFSVFATLYYLKEQILQPLIFHYLLKQQKKKKIHEYLQQFKKNQNQDLQDLMQHFYYTSSLNSSKHPAPYIALFHLLCQIAFFFIIGFFVYSELNTIFFWLIITEFVQFTAQLLKKYNKNKIPFDPIYQILVTLILFPLLGTFLDKINNNSYKFMGMCISIIPISASIQVLIYMLLIEQAIPNRSTMSMYQFKYQTGMIIGNSEKMDKISGWKKKLSAFILLACPLIEIYFGLKKNIWPLVITGFLGFKNLAVIYFALVKNAMLFETLTPIFLLFITFQMNQIQMESYYETPILNHFIEQSTIQFQIFYFGIRILMFITLVSISGTLQTMKKHFQAAKKFNSDEDQSAIQKSGTQEFIEFVYSVIWAYLVVSLSMYFAQMEESSFFSLVYQLIAIFYMIKPNIGIIVINGLWKIQYAIVLSTLLAWRLSILSLNLFLPFQASGLLFCLSILLTVLVQDEKKSKYLQIAMMGFFLFHGILMQSNIFIFEFALLLHLVIPITNSLMKKRREEKLKNNSQQGNGDEEESQQDKKKKEEEDNKRKSNPEYMLLWLCVFCLFGFSFGTITQSIYQVVDGITGNIILNRFYSLEFKQFEIILASKAVGLFEYFTQLA